MITIEEAVKLIVDNTDKLGTETIDLNKSYNRILAEDVYSDIDIPSFNKSAMDGYAVISSDLKEIPHVLTIKNVVQAGSNILSKFKNNECVKIMTGAKVPDSFDAVVKIEDTKLLNDVRVSIEKKVNHGLNICIKGEDTKSGELVLKKNTMINAPCIGTLASVGKTKVRVYRTPVVGIISTGNEIVESDALLKDGCVRNSNSPMLINMAENSGCKTKYFGIVKDEKEIIKKTFLEAIDATDILFISGGVSMGDFDLVPNILKEIEVDILFHNVKIKPGKPILFGKKKEKLVFGLPGNPVSVFVSFNMFVKTAIEKMKGNRNYTFKYLEGKLKKEVKKRKGRVSMFPARYEIIDSQYFLTPLAINGSADIIGCVPSNCLLRIDEHIEKVGAGEILSFIRID